MSEKEDLLPTARTLLECAEKRNALVNVTRWMASDAKAPLFAARAKLLADAGGEVTASFWQQTFANPQLFGGSDFLYEYDADILASLTNVTGSTEKLTADDGATPVTLRRTVTLHFGPNDFFSDKSLWLKGDFCDGAVDELQVSASGVTWRAGFGPYSPDELVAVKEADAKLAKELQALPVGERLRRDREMKRERVTRGDSFFEYFKCGPSGGSDGSEDDEEDEEDDEEDEQEEEQAGVFAEMWERIWERPGTLDPTVDDEGSDDAEDADE